MKKIRQNRTLGLEPKSQPLFYGRPLALIELCPILAKCQYTISKE